MDYESTEAPVGQCPWWYFLSVERYSQGLGSLSSFVDREASWKRHHAFPALAFCPVFSIVEWVHLQQVYIAHETPTIELADKYYHRAKASCPLKRLIVVDHLVQELMFRHIWLTASKRRGCHWSKFETPTRPLGVCPYKVSQKRHIGGHGGGAVKTKLHYGEMDCDGAQRNCTPDHRNNPSSTELPDINGVTSWGSYLPLSILWTPIATLIIPTE